MGKNGLLIPTVAAYLGAKTRLVPKLIDLINQAENITTFGEIFGGMGSTLINKSRHPVEIYNDLAVENYSIFKCFSDPDLSVPFIEAIENSEYSLDTFCKYRNVYDAEIDPVICDYTDKMDLEKDPAAQKKLNSEFNQWRDDNILKIGITSLLLTKMTPRGLILNKSFAGVARGEDQQFENWKLNLNTYAERLNGVQARNQDALEIIREYYNDPHAIFLCDSPYFGKNTNHGIAYLADSATQRKRKIKLTKAQRAEAEEKFQREYMSTIQHAKCNIIVCGYKNDLYDEYLKPEFDWECFCIDEIAKLAKNNGKGEMRDRVREYIWVNYNIH